MRKLYWSPGFFRAYKKIKKRRTEIKNDIEKALRLLADDPFIPILETHILSGKLSGAWACSINYEYRIIFDFVKGDGPDNILLMEIGTHEEVY